MIIAIWTTMGGRTMNKSPYHDSSYSQGKPKIRIFTSATCPLGMKRNSKSYGLAAPHQKQSEKAPEPLVFAAFLFSMIVNGEL